MKAALLVLAAIASPALAEQCAIPGQLPRPTPERVDPREVRDVPTTDFSLQLTWSPQYCRSGQDRSQCGRGSKFGFILHGLWPEGVGRSWPQYCRPVGALPAAVVRAGWCATPSVKLQQHEWQKHGSCITSDPATYVRTATGLFNRLRFPDMRRLGQARPTVAEFGTAFAAADRGMRPDMLRVELTSGGWLEEVRLCLDRRYRPARCPADTPGATSGQRVKIWPRER